MGRAFFLPLDFRPDKACSISERERAVFVVPDDDFLEDLWFEFDLVAIRVT